MTGLQDAMLETDQDTSDLIPSAPRSNEFGFRRCMDLMDATKIGLHYCAFYTFQGIKFDGACLNIQSSYECV